MKNALSKILISLVLVGITLAPVSADINFKADNQIAFRVEKNIAKADLTAAQIAYRAAVIKVILAQEAYDDIGTYLGFSNEGAEKWRKQVESAKKVLDDAKDARDKAREVVVKEGGGGTAGEKIAADIEEEATRTHSESKVNNYELNCSLGFFSKMNLGGCFAEFFFLLWEVSAWIAQWAGRFLDFFVYYSIDSDSYRGSFVEEGWAAVRDVANIFFIIALLYVAIQTILNLHSANTKKMLGMIITIALLLNFSLFVTKVVIDASNVLAKIFYNNITPIDENGQDASGAEGEKSISVGLVDKFNPQEIIDVTAYESAGGTGQFIFVTIMALLITLYAGYVFFTVAILFVGRLVALWLSMILAPLAFVSYTVPFDMAGFGHKEWLERLLQNAFLAPVFIFFLYLILLFLDIGKELVYTDSNDLTQKLMHVVIPFAILFILLMKAKETAVKFSGDIGKGITTAGKFVGGAALGVGAGALAVAGRAGIGRLGSIVANSATLKQAEARGVFGAKTLRNLGTAAGKGSFDIRGIKIAGKDLASAGFTGLGAGGKVKEGGFEKIRKDKVEARQKRAKELEVGEDEELKQNLNASEAHLQELLHTHSGALHDLDRAITEAKDDFDNSSGAAKDVAQVALRQARDAKLLFRTQTGIRDLERNIIPHQKLEIENESRERKRAFATTIQGGWNIWQNRISSFGQHSQAGANEAAHKIRMETKIESKDAHK